VGARASTSPCASTATASTIPASSAAILEPVLADEADIAVGSRFIGGDGLPLVAARVGSASGCSRGSSPPLTRQKVTDPTSGFQAANRLGIRLFAADYPHDYPRPRRR
jgi:hypothetical protein